MPIVQFKIGILINMLLLFLISFTIFFYNLGDRFWSEIDRNVLATKFEFMMVVAHKIAHCGQDRKRPRGHHGLGGQKIGGGLVQGRGAGGARVGGKFFSKESFMQSSSVQVQNHLPSTLCVICRCSCMQCVEQCTTIFFCCVVFNHYTL